MLVTFKDVGREWPVIRNILRTYTRGSGALFNIYKCEVLRTGSRGLEGKVLPGGFKVASYSEVLKYLGVPVGVELNLRVFWEKRR